jgi:hypothetical protein
MNDDDAGKKSLRTREIVSTAATTFDELKNILSKRRYVVYEEAYGPICLEEEALWFLKYYFGSTMHDGLNWDKRHQIRSQSHEGKDLNDIKREVYIAWYQLVQDYTKREMTIDTDRIPALSGLAAKYAAVSQDRYVSGLWAGNIAYGLLW